MESRARAGMESIRERIAWHHAKGVHIIKGKALA